MTQGHDNADVPIPESVRDNLIARARESWPGLLLDGVRFAQHVASRWPEILDGKDVPESVHVADLYLAFGCLQGDERASRAFHDTYFSHLERPLARINGGSTLVDEVKQDLSEKLLRGVDQEKPGLTQYTGAGPLKSWVDVAALHMALSKVRRKSPLDSLEALAEVLADPRDPRLSAMQARYLATVTEALRDALRGLSERQRRVLRLNLVKRVSMTAIGSLYDVHQSTVSHWIKQARDDILESFRKRIGDLGNEDLESVVQAVRSQIDLSLSGSSWSSSMPAPAPKPTKKT